MVSRYIVSAFVCTAASGLFALSEEGPAEYLENYDAVLIKADAAQSDSSFVNAGHWSPAAVPEAGKTYYVPSGMRINDPGGQSNHTFPGTLVLSGCIQAMCAGGRTLTFRPLRMQNGSKYYWSSFNSVGGDVYIDSVADDPARFALFYHTGENLVGINAAFHGGEDNVVVFDRRDTPKANSLIPGLRYSFGGSFADYSGTVVIASNSLFEVKNNSTGRAKIKVEKDGYIRIGRGAGTLEVRSLDLQDGSHFELLANYQLGTDTAPVYITEKLKIGNNVKLDGFKSIAGVTSSDYRLALFRLSGQAVANGVELPDKIELPEKFFGILPKNPRLEIADDANGTKTLYIVYDPMLAVVKYKDTAPGGVGAFTPGNDGFWDPAGIPDSNTNADIMVGVPILWSGGRASWPNARFVLANTAYIQNAELNANLHVCSGSIMNYGNGFDFTGWGDSIRRFCDCETRLDDHCEAKDADSLS